MSKAHSVIIIPGLGDEIRAMQLATRHWQQYGLKPIVHSMGWRDGESEFQPKLDRLLELMDMIIDKGHKVSIVGTSAGGSAAINAFYERNTQMYRVINVCGRLKVGPMNGFRSFQSKTRTSPAFAQSVRLCERRIPQLPSADRQRIMTVHALFGDELVPTDTTIIEGANNTFVPTFEHMVSITLALTLFSRPLINFLTD